MVSPFDIIPPGGIVGSGQERDMMTKDYKTQHKENLVRLARVDGQVRGIRRMIEEGEYCVDILTQIQATRSALQAIGRRILKKHLEHCVADAMKQGDAVDAAEKMDEIMKLLEQCDR